MFHRTFTDRRITSGVMLKVMKQAGLKKKKIRVVNIPARKEDRIDEFNDRTLEVDNRIYDII